MSCFNFQEVLIFFWFSPLDIDYMMFYLRHGITTSNIPKVREWLDLDLSKSCKGNNYATVFTLYALVMILRQIRASPDANGRSLQEETNKEVTPGANDQAQEAMKIDDDVTTKATDGQPDPKANLSEKRKALFEPLEPLDGRRTPAEMLLPPPDFEPASYPKGWVVGKKRKLVNVDVVESMRRIAIQEMNRKDREINGLNEQLEEDSRVLEHLQKQLAEERKKRVEMEKENSMLQDQVSMLMNMLEQNETFDDDEGEVPPPDP